MDEVQREIAQMIGTPTKVLAPSGEQIGILWRWHARIQAWRSERKLPRGQRFIRAGFKAVTLPEMRERFAIDRINASRWDKEIDRCLFNRNTRRELVTIKEVSPYPNSGKFFLTWIDKASGEDGIASTDIPRTKERPEATVRIDSLHEYIRDEIPKRVMENIALAARMGIKAKDLYVAYPVVEMVPEDDPIVVYPWQGEVNHPNTVYLEIGYWE